MQNASYLVCYRYSLSLFSLSMLVRLKPISATLTITDPVAYHAHTPGSIFTVQIEAAYSGTNNQVFYQWLDSKRAPAHQQHERSLTNNIDWVKKGTDPF